MNLNKLFVSCIIVSLVISAFFVQSCKKGTDSKITIIIEDAIVVNTGDPAADGCGWLLKTNTDSTYNAPNLAVQYQVNNLKIHIAYHKLTTRYYCGQLPIPQNHGITQVQLDTIKTR